MTPQQINIYITHAEKTILSLNQTISKITTRKDQFIVQYGNKTNDVSDDLTVLSLSELKTNLTVLNKLRSEIKNMETAILFEIQNTDKEINRR